VSTSIASRDIPRLNQDRPSFKDAWRKSEDSGKVPKRKEPIGTSGFGVSRILRTRNTSTSELRSPKSRQEVKLRCGAQLTSSHQNRGIGNLHSEIPDADLSRPSVGTRGRDRGFRKISRKQSPSALRDSENRGS
jgi:hypothetical protein